MRYRETAEGYASEKERRREYWRLWQRAHRERRIARKQCCSCPNEALPGRTICGDCSRRIVEAAKRRYAENPELRRAAYFSNTSRLYGLTRQQFNDMLCAQSGLCAMCWQPFDEREHKLKVCVDHKGDKVRGLLHIQCNISLGIYEALREDAQRYLEHAASQ